MTRSIINRLRDFVGNRRDSQRRAAQRTARLVFSVSVLDAKTPSAATRVIPIEGYTRDISETGLALIVPSLIIGGNHLTDESCTLRIVLLDLPTGRIEIHAAPVRYEQLAGSETAYLIGARITHISESDRSRLVQYLRSLP